MYNKENIIFYMLLCLLTIILDQASKWCVLSNLNINSIVQVFTGFNLVLAFNYGTSFGLLSPNTMYGTYCLIGFSILLIIILLCAFFKFKNNIERILLSILVGGAIANLIDRIIHGAVVDFIDIYYKTWHWPAFNFADISITCSAIGLILYNLFKNNSK